MASPASRTRRLGPGAGDPRSLDEAALRAARGSATDLGARSQLPGEAAPLHGDASSAGVIGPRADGQQRPHAALQARGECTARALPLRVASPRLPATSPPHRVATSEAARPGP